MSEGKDSLAPAPFATFSNLRLYGIREQDEKKLFNLASDIRCQRTGPGTVFPRVHNATKVKNLMEFLTPSLFAAVIESTVPLQEGLAPEDDDRFVGLIHIWQTSVPKNRDGMFGIMLDPRWWGRGIGKTATKWVVDYAFEQLGLHRITLEMIPSNIAAYKIYKGVGFVEEGRKRKQFWQDGQWNDLVLMGILEEEWAERRKLAQETTPAQS